MRAAAAGPGTPEALGALLRAYYQQAPRHEFLLLNCFPYCALPTALQNYFVELDPVTRAGQVPPSAAACSLRLSARADFLPDLVVRRALMKDHDDLVSIFEQQNTNLKERFGEFFLADLIQQAGGAAGGAAAEGRLALIGLD